MTGQPQEGFAIRKAEVVEVVSEEAASEAETGRAIRKQNLRIIVETDAGRREALVANELQPVKAGDAVFARTSLFGSGEESFEIMDVSRSRGLFLLLLFFAGIVVAISGGSGARSLIGLVFSFSVILGFIIPRILAGGDPVAAGLGGAMLILVVALYLAHGFTKKSAAAFLGITCTLLFVSALAKFSVGAMRFTGFGGEESVFLNMAVGSAVNLTALVVAGIIIAAIGVLDDVAVTQASTVFALAAADVSLRGWVLFRRSMEVGRDHISAVVNTLVLAYTGAALPLILLFTVQRLPAAYVVSSEVIAEEIVRTLISSSGLVLAVPLVTWIAVLMSGRKMILTKQ